MKWTLLAEINGQLLAAEIKAGMTYQPALLSGLKRLRGLTPEPGRSYLIYAGQPFTFSDGTAALHYSQVPQLFAK